LAPISIQITRAACMKVPDDVASFWAMNAASTLRQKNLKTQRLYFYGWFRRPH